MIRWLLLMLILALPVHAALAPLDFGETPSELPPVLRDTTKAAQCVVAYLVADTTTNDMIAVRMRIAPDPNDHTTDNLLPCPKVIPPRLSSRALDACAIRAADPQNCVYGDMARDFDKHPTPNFSAENTSRCSSDVASHIGVACWAAGRLQVCATGCGDSPEHAIAAAATRCEAKQQRPCPITGALPVLAPQ